MYLLKKKAFPSLLLLAPASSLSEPAPAFVRTDPSTRVPPVPSLLIPTSQAESGEAVGGVSSPARAAATPGEMVMVGMPRAAGGRRTKHNVANDYRGVIPFSLPPFSFFIDIVNAFLHPDDDLRFRHPTHAGHGGRAGPAGVHGAERGGWGARDERARSLSIGAPVDFAAVFVCS